MKRIKNYLKVIQVFNFIGYCNYPGCFTKEEIRIIKKNIVGKTLHLFSGESDIGDIRVDFSFGNIKQDVFEYLKNNLKCLKKMFKDQTIILDPPYNKNYANEYKELGDTPKQFVIFANNKETSLLFRQIKKIEPMIIIMKSWNYYIPEGYSLKEGYLCYSEGFRKPTILLIMKKIPRLTDFGDKNVN